MVVLGVAAWVAGCTAGDDGPEAWNGLDATASESSGGGPTTAGSTDPSTSTGEGSGTAGDDPGLTSDATGDPTDPTGDDAAPPPDLPPKPDPLGTAWTWIMPLDHAIREDDLGGGHFGAPRSGNPGGHSGIDVLAPVGTPLLAPCDGPVWAGWASGYGNYVQLACPLPEALTDGASLYASVFFAHLDTLAVADGSDVVAGQTVGTVGKTGNADSPGINAHVHFELAIHDSEAAALAELHVSSDHSGNAASDAFAALIAERCWDPQGFLPLSGPSMKGRRPDPFMAMACLSDDKPMMTPPPAGLQAVGLVPWSDHYEATGFPVDEG